MKLSKKGYIKLKSKQVLQIFITFLILLSLYFLVKLVQRPQSLSSNAGSSNPTATAILSFSNPTPSNPQMSGGTFSTSVLINTAGQAIYGVDASINFDPKLLQVVSVIQTQNNGFTSYPSNRFNNNKGEIQLSANIGTGTNTAITGAAINVANITFHVIAPITSTNITYAFTLGNRNDSNVVPESNRGKGITDILGSVIPLNISTTSPTPTPTASPTISPSALPSATPTPTPTISPTASPTPTPSSTPSPVNVSLNIGIQGKDTVTAGQTTALTIFYKSPVSPINSQLITLTGSGLGSFTIEPDNYVFLLKTNSYLKRRYGSLASPIVVNSSSSNLNFTLDPLLGGDFNNDGIINEIDYTALFLPSFASNDSTVDLDASGQVNNLDFAIMRSNWGLTDDIIE